jgi:hypothetical protein
MEHTRFCHSVAPDDVLLQGATDQLAVIFRCEWVTFGYPGDLPVLVVGGDEDVIGLVKNILEMGYLVCIVIVVDLQVQVTPIDAAEGIVYTGPERQDVWI